MLTREGMSARASCIMLAETILLTIPLMTTSADYSFIYAGCTSQKFIPGSTYESNHDSLLTSLVNSAMISSSDSPTFNKYTLSGPTPSDTIYGLYQCRGDLAGPACGQCVANSLTRIGSICGDSCGGALQLEGCLVKYDNVSFFGKEDKTVVFKKCGPVAEYEPESLTRRDAILTYLTGGGRFYRVGRAAGVQGVAQCVEDLTPGECQDCLSDAIGRLRGACRFAVSGDMYLGKCYARFWGDGISSAADRIGWLWMLLLLVLLPFCL